MTNKASTTKERIIKYLEQGLCFKYACIASGVTEQSGYRYKREDISFVSQCEGANAKYIQKLIQYVNKEALRDGKFALKVLKIRYPDVWAPQRKVQKYDSSSELQQIHDMIYGQKCPREVH